MCNQNTSSYSQLNHLIHAYLNQDYELSGETIEEVVACYRRDRSSGDRSQLLEDMDRFRKDHPENLDKAFLDLYGFDFDPQLWDISASEFFNVVKRVLRELD